MNRLDGTTQTRAAEWNCNRQGLPAVLHRRMLQLVGAWLQSGARMSIVTTQQQLHTSFAHACSGFFNNSADDNGGQGVGSGQEGVGRTHRDAAFNADL